jgi:alpha-beta hydrolase superfamily lysophospholipase
VWLRVCLHSGKVILAVSALALCGNHANGAVSHSAGPEECVTFAASTGMDSPTAPTISKTVAGVPILVAGPDHASKTTPIIIMLHGFGSPNSPEELAKMIPPLPGTVTVYPSLPLLGVRMPSGGVDELVRRQSDDYIGRLLYPAILGAAHELPRVIKSVTHTYGLARSRPIAIFGFSAGGAAALLALTETQVKPTTLIALNAPLDIGQAIEAYQRQTGRTYEWTAVAREAAIRYDVAVNAKRIADANPKTSILLLQSERDPAYSPSTLRATVAALNSAYAAFPSSAGVSASILPDAGHNVLEEESRSREGKPTKLAARSLILEWLASHLCTPPPE